MGLVSPSRRPTTTALGAVLAALAASAAAAGSAAGAQPLAPAAGGLFKPGSGSIGDTLYPTLGNGGYDAVNYDLDLAFGAAPADPITGTITLTARATQFLSSFSLDYDPAAGDSIGTVLVNGLPAKVTQGDGKLVVTPRVPLLRGVGFVTQIRGFVATPRTYDEDDPTSVALVAAPSGTVVAGQAQYAHTWLPSNDTPADKASFTFRLSAPAGETAVANGLSLGKSTSRGRTTWSYLQRQPMATELLQLAVGDYDVVDRPASGGVKVRDVVVRSEAASLKPQLAIESSQLDWMRSKVGRYPFDVYGSFVMDVNLGFALETQTMSMYDTTLFSDPDYGEGYWKPTMLHELSHQWFGDDVAPTDWAGIWLNEGHATWYETTWAAENGYLEDDTGIADFDALNKRIYELGDQYRADHGPVARPLSGSDADLFSVQSYYGGLLVLYALRQEVGTPVFEKIERQWVQTYSGKSANTQDFIALSSRVAGRDLAPFLNAWLYGTTTPPMPGHPDWTVLPVKTTAVQARSLVAPAGALTAPRRH